MEMLRSCVCILLCHCRVGMKKLHKMPENCQSIVMWCRATHLREELKVGVCLWLTFVFIGPQGLLIVYITHSLLWLISPFLSAWGWQRLKCWLIWFLSLGVISCCQCLTRCVLIQEREDCQQRCHWAASSYKILLG